DRRQAAKENGKDGSKPSGKPAPKPEAAPAAEPDAKPAAPDDKLIGRQAAQWTQTSQADFERGSRTNTAVTPDGEVRLAPALQLAHESSEQFIWSVLGMGGAIYAGTGNGGQVLKVDADNKASVFFRTGELEVHALARDRAGKLYAGTSPGGKIFRIGPDG